MLFRSRQRINSESIEIILVFGRTLSALGIVKCANETDGALAEGIVLELSELLPINKGPIGIPPNLNAYSNIDIMNPSETTPDSNVHENKNDGE